MRAAIDGDEQHPVRLSCAQLAPVTAPRLVDEKDVRVLLLGSLHPSSARRRRPQHRNRAVLLERGGKRSGERVERNGRPEPA